MPGESLDELRSRLAVLRECGVSSHDPSTGRVTFWAPAPASPPSPARVPTALVTEAEREKAVEDAEAKRRRRNEQWLFAATEGIPDDIFDDEAAEAH